MKPEAQIKGNASFLRSCFTFSLFRNHIESGPEARIQVTTHVLRPWTPGPESEGRTCGQMGLPELRLWEAPSENVVKAAVFLKTDLPLFYGIWKYSPISISRSSHERGKEKGLRLPTAGRLFARLMVERARVCRHWDLNSEHQTGNVFGRFSVTRLAFVVATKKMRHPVPHPPHPGEPTAGQRGRGESGSLRRGGAWHGGSLNTVFRRS